MNYDYYLKRQKSNLKDLINKRNITEYVDLVKFFKSINIQPPAYEEVKELFEEETKNVEERPVVKSSTKKKRVPSQKSGKSKTNDSTSAGGSGSKQRVRKSTTKRQRKSDSNKVEPVQPTSGSEDTK